MGQWSVWHFWAWMQPIDSIASRPTLTMSHAEREGDERVLRQAELAGADERDVVA